MERESYLELRVDELLARVAAADEAPGGGTVAALTVAAAAGLVAMVARCSHTSWPDAAGVAAQALQAQKRAGFLAGVDAHAWEDARAGLRGAADGEGPGDAALERKLEHAAAVPLELAGLGADVAELAALAGEHCEGSFQADAVAAAALAAGATKAALHLVEVNLGVREGDTRLARARESDQAAEAATERVLGSIR